MLEDRAGIVERTRVGLTLGDVALVGRPKDEARAADFGAAFDDILEVLTCLGADRPVFSGDVKSFRTVEQPVEADDFEVAFFGSSDDLCASFGWDIVDVVCEGEGSDFDTVVADFLDVVAGAPKVIPFPENFVADAEFDHVIIQE